MVGCSPAPEPWLIFQMPMPALRATRAIPMATRM